ncbi:ATP-binding protein [Mesonia sp.]|uniref:sensor histidine kinase n=1 Tax=Mesonia sp. TaxID=1960830 RepID=UPI000C93D35A|nr:ATP-binding protein [Mesonia sp.]MAN26412.1 two-component sensor histidine kinase [Mesonia sp.]
MKLNFKTRIALNYFFATGIVVALVFAIVFISLNTTIYESLDSDLNYESEVHLEELDLENMVFSNREEWEEREHEEVEVNPVFVQIINSEEKITDKSPNLNADRLQFFPEKEDHLHFNTIFNNRLIRQVQEPVKVDGKLSGYIITAMSFEASQKIIDQLWVILLISYPIIVIVLFFISRFLAGRSIAPIKDITQITERINQNNLQERVNLPENKDELYNLSASINSLLKRIEEALERERQFTSDASHELRTPLAALRGNLEVLIRKVRNPEEYEKRIKTSLLEIDRLSEMVEQLLFLARFDKQKTTAEKADLIILLDEALQRNKHQISARNLKIEFTNQLEKSVEVPKYYTSIIIENLLSNAIKYSSKDETIKISVEEKTSAIQLKITNYGEAIALEDHAKIFKPFYRTQNTKNLKINGTGLGLSIVKKAAEAIYAKIQLKSNLAHGTSFIVLFKKDA